MTAASAKLLHTLLGKAILETILIGALSLLFFVQAFPPHFRGWGEVNQQTILGWASNTADPMSRVDVQLFIDGVFVAQRSANEFRPDVHAAGWAVDDWHGYRFELPNLSPGKHQAKVYALYSSRGGKRQTLQLLGDPVELIVESSGEIRGLKTTR